MLPSVTTAAFGAERTVGSRVDDFCRFTLERSDRVSDLQGADGSALSLDEERLLHALNRAAHGQAMRQGAAASIGAPIVSEPSLVRHLRYVLVQTALPRQSVISACRRLGSGLLEAGDRDLQRIGETLEEN